MLKEKQFSYLFKAQQPEIANDARIVMVDGGIIVMGFYSENEREITLKNAAIVKRWGAGDDMLRGLGAFQKGPNENIDVDSVYGEVHIPKVREILSLKIDAIAWASKLLPPPEPVDPAKDMRIVIVEGGIVHVGLYSETYNRIYMRRGVVLRLWGVDTNTPGGLSALYNGPLKETLMDFNGAILSHPFSRKLLDMPTKPEAWEKVIPPHVRELNDFWV